MPPSYSNRTRKYTVPSCSGLRNPQDCPSPEPKPIDDQQRASAQSRQGCLQCPRGRQALLSAPQALPASLQAGGQRAAIPAPGPARRRLVAGNRSRAGNPLQYPSPPSTGPCSPGACPLTQGNICGAGASRGLGAWLPWLTERLACCWQQR